MIPESHAAAILVAAIALVYDLKDRRIPNKLTYPAAVIGWLLGAIDGGATGFFMALGGSAVAALMFVVPVAKSVMGTGDLKLAMAIGAFGGPSFALWMSLFSMVAGAILSLLYLLARRLNSPTVARLFPEQRKGNLYPSGSGLTIPYAAPMMIGTVTAVIAGRSLW